LADSGTASTAPNAAVSTPAAPSTGAVAQSPGTPSADVTDISQVGGKKAAAPAPTPADDEYDIDGEKVKRSQLEAEYKRRKEFDRAAHKRMQEAAELRKQVAAEQAEYDRIWQNLEKDPYELYRKRGMSEEQLDQIAEQRLVQRMKRAQMTPEQIQAEEYQQRNQQLEAELNERKQSEQKQRQEMLAAKYTEHFDSQISQAMQIGNLPRTASTGAKVAQVMLEYMQAGEQIEPAMAAQIVRDNHHAEIGNEFTELRNQLKAGRITQEKFVSYVSGLIGADTVKALQQSAIKQAQNFEPQRPAQPKAPAIPKQGFDSFEEANKWIDTRIKKHG